MGTYVNGANGAFRGKVGSVVGSSWNRINYLKGLPNVKRNPTPTESQKDQQSKVDIVGRFMKRVKRVVALGFDSGEGKSDYSNAMSYMLTKALDTSVTPYQVKYNQVKLTSGELPYANDMAVALDATSGQLAFSWKNNPGIELSEESDVSVLIAYSPSMNRIIFTRKGPQRSAETGMLNVSAFKGQTIETYMAFLKPTERMVSESFYTGQVILP